MLKREKDIKFKENGHTLKHTKSLKFTSVGSLFHHFISNWFAILHSFLLMQYLNASCLRKKDLHYYSYLRIRGVDQYQFLVGLRFLLFLLLLC